jgi:alpha-ketoglutarate-dependent taurine dioxygenase
VLFRVLDSGKIALYVNGHFTREIFTEEVLGDDLSPKNDSSCGGILAELLGHITAMEPMRMGWRESDVVLWDEAATQHAAVHDYFGARRELHRVLVSGRAPPKGPR